jgi:hypothetical protein
LIKALETLQDGVTFLPTKLALNMVLMIALIATIVPVTVATVTTTEVATGWKTTTPPGCDICCGMLLSTKLVSLLMVYQLTIELRERNWLDAR